MRKRLFQAFPAAVTGLVVLAGLHLMGLPTATPVTPAPTVDLTEALLAASNPTLDLFVEFTPAPGAPVVKGESVAKTHVGVVEATSMRFATSNPATVGLASTGAGTGKAQFDQLVLTKGLDLASAPLFLATATGSHYNKVVITMDKPGTGLKVLRLTLGTVFVPKVDIAATPIYTETVNLAFAAAKLEYFASNAAGTPATVASNIQSWSVIANAQVPDL